MLSCFHSDPSLQKKKKKKQNRKAQVLKFDHFHMIYTIFLFPILTFVIQELKKKKSHSLFLAESALNQGFPKLICLSESQGSL